MRLRGRSYFSLYSPVINISYSIVAQILIFPLLDKVEKFKYSKDADCLHAKYHTGITTVVGDQDWGHLHLLYATSIFLLFLAMTASGLHIVYTCNEVNVVQNRMFYIETAYKVANFGMEQGDKTNQATQCQSVGMAKAALEALDGLNLFGAKGGPESVVHALSDDIQRCQVRGESFSVLSTSKEVDAGVLSIISYPAFAVEDIDIVNITKEEIKKFLIDGHKSPKDNSNRLYYESSELKRELKLNIECEPLFWIYLILDGVFINSPEQVQEYGALDAILIKGKDGLRLVSELYSASKDKVDEEYVNLHTVEVPVGKCPMKWAQSQYTLGNLLAEGFLAPGEIDSLNRCFATTPKPEVVVQVSILAETEEIKQILQNQGIYSETLEDIHPIRSPLPQPSRILSHIYARLGRNQRLGLTGRPYRSIDVLGTSKSYIIRNTFFSFTPQSPPAEGGLDRFRAAAKREMVSLVHKAKTLNIRYGLLSDLYEKASSLISGMLRRKVAELDKACTDLLAHQEHLTVGFPPEPGEKTISALMTPDKLTRLIDEASVNNLTTAILMQEIMVYLAMSIRSQPKLFSEMFRLRIGLIIQVMVTELAQSLNCSGEDATESLMNLAPCELKTLLLQILSAKEFRVRRSVCSAGSGISPAISIQDKSKSGSAKDQLKGSTQVKCDVKLPLSVHSLNIDNIESGRYRLPPIESFQDSLRGAAQDRKQGGALNRIPVCFYQNVWKILQKCDSLLKPVLSSSTTKEMTPGEIKFAVHVETVLNPVPQPEYKQLLVEEILVLIMLSKVDIHTTGGIIHAEKIVQMARDMFHKDQKGLGADDTILEKDQSNGICRLFYDSAPSGRFGTMTYLSKAVATYVDEFLPTGSCALQ
ncbi:LOW QUALITY PROTEIN: phosphorylase b kinase regulatory subunit alpha, skeletal muscle isoform [Clarias gariepinus]